MMCPILTTEHTDRLIEILGEVELVRRRCDMHGEGAVQHPR
jgi:hypothetical protein